ncbi:AI-2E family transporter [Agaricicola taiwanensis]|uniref:AI-2E family transporter n=1 Tax=Agaricicola taiwanensis TaxID=591372 RepID=A0A8J2YHT3_9RHOB|nr:AI-2E family transporter [Agaricicola taiwanensis]
MTLQRQAFFWGVALVVSVLLLWLLSDILLPFVAGMALAYLLDPVADRLQRVGMSRLVATLFILLGFIVLLVIVLVVVVPLMVEQLGQFIAKIPDYVNTLQQTFAGPGQAWLRDLLGSNLEEVQGSLGEVVSQGASYLTSFLTQLWAGSQAIISLVSLVVVTPVVTFYMLVDWDRMVGSIDRFLPLEHRETIRQLAREINRAVSGFLRGQAVVCFFLGAFYGVGLTLVGLNFGLLIGIGAGALSFIPYVGSITGFVVAIAVALAQFWPDWVSVFLVAAVFGVGQFIEGNILQPKLVGNAVGLHPVWLMFALFAFGALFGFVGLLLAVPISAAIAVLVRFGLMHYQQSRFYDSRFGQPLTDDPVT